MISSMVQSTNDAMYFVIWNHIVGDQFLGTQRVIYSTSHGTKESFVLMCTYFLLRKLLNDTSNIWETSSG